MISCQNEKYRDICININDKVHLFESGRKAVFLMKYPMDHDLYTIDSFFSRILNKTNRPYLLETTVSILREIILNASKANYKRIFFKDNNLDITNDEDYSQGMENFKNALARQDVISSTLNLSDFWIKIACYKSNLGMIIETENNISPTWQEQERIDDRMKKSKTIHSFTHAYENVFDTIEGAGLGLLLIYLLMKNAGIDYSFFQINYKKRSVQVRFTIPWEIVKPELKTIISQQIRDEVDALPALPGYVIELQKLCRQPDISIDTIADKLSRDPSLAAGVLRLANSAAFISCKKIKTLHDAILIVGLNNLELILTIAAAKKIMESRYRRFKFIWEHCNKCAVYGRIIAIKKGMKHLADTAFISGILHDIGKIILLTIEPETTADILKLLEKRQVSSSALLEEITIGISHSEIGALIAEKWNFPVHIIEPIKMHHAPSLADEEYKNLVMIVHLANNFCNIEDHNARSLAIEDQVLYYFNIEDRNDLELFHQDVKEAYSQIEIA